MMITVDCVEVTSEKIELPESCPGCGASFTDTGDCALVRYDLRYEYGPAFIDEKHADVSFDESAEMDSGEVLACPVDFGCNRCPWMWSASSPARDE